MSKIYALWKDLDESDLVLQKEEVSGVLWIDFDKCVESVKAGSFKHCILMEELMLLKKYLDERERRCTAT
ncbi:hypothetical protein [Ruminococcus albus]|uniref:hypothetical protein n=1 Tax=Ruminococcus albus TaxID=1264 RepID=UPI0002E3C144